MSSTSRRGESKGSSGESEGTSPSGGGEYIGRYVFLIEKDKSELKERLLTMNTTITDLESFVDKHPDIYKDSKTSDKLGGYLSNLRAALALVYVPMMDKELSAAEAGFTDQMQINGQPSSGAPTVIVQQPHPVQQPQGEGKEKPPKISDMVARALMPLARRRGKKAEDPLDQAILDLGRSLQKRMNQLRKQHGFNQSIFLIYNDVSDSGVKSRQMKSQLMKMKVKSFCDALTYAESCGLYIGNKLNQDAKAIAEAQAHALTSLVNQTLEGEVSTGTPGFPGVDRKRKQKQK